MKFSIFTTRSICWILLLAFAAAFPTGAIAGEAVVTKDANKTAKNKAAEKAAQKLATKSADWATSLADGYQRAASEHKPMLIIVGANWCPLCRQLTADCKTAAVCKELSRWSAVYLDIDASPAGIDDLGVAGVPALRVRTSDGRQAAEHDGYLASDALVEWLQKNYEAATARADDVLLASGTPTAVAVIRLVKQFEQRNPALREAAIRRLLAGPSIARPAVLRAFAEGNLAARLAAMEVLTDWRAPLDGFDPWRPETFTPERLAKLEKWKERELADERVQPENLTEKQLADARREIDRMLTADAAEADAIRQRLARLGPALMPEVYTRLKTAVSDQDQRRLLTLRYRLAASDALALRWPGGIDRLAHPDARERERAAAELAKAAGENDQALLLELFADSDPLVREISLRGMQQAGGKRANAAMVKLLADPAPNVRAAVLKQLEESPDAQMVPAVMEYLKSEKDPDLLVHGICVLCAAHSKASLKCLIALLKHESWQVRAEAAVGIGKLNESDRFGGSAPTGAAAQLQVDANVALVDLLGDSDGFVVAKAVEGLGDADLSVAVEPLAKAAAAHPDLAVHILEKLASGGNMRTKAMPHFRNFCKDKNPQVRAAAVTAISQTMLPDVQEVLHNAIADPASEVRLAAAHAMFHQLEGIRRAAENEAKSRPIAVQSSASSSISLLDSVLNLLNAKPVPNVTLVQVEAGAAKKPDAAKSSDPKKEVAKQEPTKKKPADSASKKTSKEKNEKHWWDAWLEEWHAGKRRPKWMVELVGPFETMLEAKDARERAAAALVLVPLGKAERAMPVLIDAAKANPEALDSAAGVLPWLPWAERIKVFRQLNSPAVSGQSESAFPRLIYALCEVPDRRATDLLWELLGDSRMTDDYLPIIEQALSALYVGEEYRYRSSTEIPSSVRRELGAAAKPRALAGNDRQRLAALALLANIAPDEASEVAAKLADDQKLSETVRTTAFQVLLCVQSGKEANAKAAAALRGKDVERKKIAMKYLIRGSIAITNLTTPRLHIRTASYSSGESGKLIVPKPPKGIALDDVRPLLDDRDEELAAYAGYLAVLLGEPGGMTPLLSHWRNNDDDNWRNMVYRAIAVTDDPQYMPVLKEIYAKLDKSEMREFYWTIRMMTGQEILKLRKQIRDEVGMSELQ